MITLAKRPQPQLGTTPATKQYSEEEYARLMKDGAHKEGHRPKHDPMFRFDLRSLK